MNRKCKMPVPPSFDVPPAENNDPALSEPGPGTRRSWLMGTGALALAPLLPACGGGGGGSSFFVPETPKPSPDAAAIDWGRETIRADMAAEGGPVAFTAALYRDGQVVWQEAFGVIDRDSGRPATPQTRFNIGSVSKVLAALATMVLVDRKRVDLDTPFATYRPEFRMLSPAYRRITVRQLLSHSSGLPGTYFPNAFAFEPLRGYGAHAEAAMADRHLKHEPGELAVYNNDGFTMIERLVLAVTGQEYPAFVKQHILDPLEMTESSYPLEPLPDGSFAYPYEPNGVRHGQEYVLPCATGGLRSTAGDMLKLAAMLIDKGLYKGRRIVSEAAVAAMAQDQTPGLRINPSPEWRWGLGWDSVQQPGLHAAGVSGWSKNGGTIFFTSDFFVLPQARMALFISGNGRYNSGRLAEGVLLRALQGNGKLDKLPASLASDVPAAATPAPADVEAVRGVYGSYTMPVRVVSADGQTLDLLEWKSKKDGSFEWVLSDTGQGLRLRTDGWWWSDSGGGVSYRWTEEGGHRYLMTRRPLGLGHYRVTMPIGQQMPPAPAPLPAEWVQLLDSRWGLAEEDPSSTAVMNGIVPAYLRELPELPGYLFWDDSELQQFLLPESGQRAGMTVKVPVNHGRDLMELVLQTRGSEQWLDVGGSLYRPLPAA